MADLVGGRGEGTELEGVGKVEDRVAVGLAEGGLVAERAGPDTVEHTGNESKVSKQDLRFPIPADEAILSIAIF